MAVLFITIHPNTLMMLKAIASVDINVHETLNIAKELSVNMLYESINTAIVSTTFLSQNAQSSLNIEGVKTGAGIAILASPNKV